MQLYKYPGLLFLWLFVFVIVPLRSYGQNNQVKLAGVPAWVNKISADTAVASPKKDISDGYYLMLSDKQYNDSTHSIYYHFVQKIISESGIENGSDISVSFDPAYQNLVFHSIKVIRNGKEINKLDLHTIKVVQEEPDEDEKVYRGKLSAECLLHDIRKGDILEYSYSLNGENPIFKNKVFHDLDIEFSVPVGRIYYRVIFPKDCNVQIKYFKTEERFKKGLKGNEYIMDITNAPIVNADEKLPSWYCAFGYVQLSQFSTWGEYAAWAVDNFKNTGSISSELSSKIKGLRKENAGDKDFVLACIRFVQDEIRYEGVEIGENNQRPYPPSEVFAQRYGDCKDKSFLLCIMLRAEGFMADPVLVNAENRQEVGEWLPSPTDFNHCIVKITLNGVNYWIDPTITLQRGVLDSLSFPEYKLGLVVNSKTQSLDTIPEKIIGRTETSETYKLMDTAYTSQLTVSTKYSGIEADGMRNYFAETSRTNIEKNFTNFYANTYPDISIIDSVQYEDNEKNNIITTTEKYNIQNIWEKINDGWKALFLANNLRSKLTIPNSKNRKTPIRLKYPVDFIQTINIEPFRKWKIAFEESSIKMDGLWYTYNKSYEDGIVSIKYHLKLTKDFIGTDQLDAYFKNTGKIIDNAGYSLLWHPDIKDADGASNGFTINWIMVFVCVFFLLFIFLVFHKLYKIDFGKSAYAENSSPIGGWLIVFAIILFFSTLRVLYWILTNSYFSLEKWNLITSPGTLQYNPGRSALLIIELTGNLLLMSFCIYLLILFFKKRTSFPKTIIAFFMFDIIFVTGDHLGALAAGIGNSELSGWYHVVRAIIPAAIWIPYFLVSVRVKETFTRTYKQISNNEKIVPPKAEEEASI